MNKALLLLLAGCVLAANSTAQYTPDKPASSEPAGERSLAQIDVRQDRDPNYYIENVYKLRVQGKDPEVVNKEWKDFIRNHTMGGYCFDLYTVPVFPRPIGDQAAVLDVGGKAQFVSIVELAPGSKTEWHSYGYNGEPLYFIVQGKGYTEYYSDAPPWDGGMPAKKYEWSKATLFALPPDHYVRHVNTDPKVSVRMLQVIGYGVNLFPYVPEDRRWGVENPAETREARARMLRSGGTNEAAYFNDLRELKLVVREERADSSGFFDVANTAGHRTHPNVHVSQLLRAQANAHKHGGRPVFVILQGRGHDLWSPANSLEEFRAAVKNGEAHRADYKEGSLCGVPAGPHWHQHFGEDANYRLRYLAIVPRAELAPKDTQGQQ